MMRLILLVASAVATTQASWPLTPDGWGPAKIGMSRAGVERALHARLEGEPIVDAKACVEMAPVGTDRGMRFMFMDHKLSRISIEEPSKVTTSRGIGIGASASAVHRAYGSSLKSHPKYDYPPGGVEDVIFWPKAAKRGVRFIIGEDRRVDAILTGTDSIYLVEGCL